MNPGTRCFDPGPRCFGSQYPLPWTYVLIAWTSDPLHQDCILFIHDNNMSTMFEANSGFKVWELGSKKTWIRRICGSSRRTCTYDKMYRIVLGLNSIHRRCCESLVHERSLCCCTSAPCRKHREHENDTCRQTTTVFIPVKS